MTPETIIGEWEFHIVDKNEVEDEKESNLKNDLIDLWIIDYEELSEDEKKEIDKLEQETRNGSTYEWI